jgi:MerR family copper efflux transcriptional regulator
MDDGDATLSIGELAQAAGVGVETIRYYERQGILPEPPRSPAGYRRYADADRWRLAFVRRAKALGFSLREVGVLLGAGERRSVPEVRRVTEERLATVEGDLVELARRSEQLRLLLETCETGSDDDCLELSTQAPAPGPGFS